MKIVYFILNSFDIDSRARLEVAALGEMGHKIEIIATVGSESQSYLGFPIHRLPQWSQPTRKFRFAQYNILAARLARKISPDICHAVDLDTLQAAVRAAQRVGAKVVYEARELYTELEALAGRPRIQAIWRNLEAKLIAKANKVFTINHSIAAELSSRYGIAEPPVVRNVAPLSQSLKPLDLHKLFEFPKSRKLLIYQGVLRKGQGLMMLLEIMRHVPDEIALVIVGSGPEESALKSHVRISGLQSRVKFAGRVDPADLLNYTAGADAGLLLMEDVALNNRLALPQKLFQYLMAGIPQIVSPMPEISSFVKTEKTGLVIEPSDPEVAASSIVRFLSDESALSEIKYNCRVSAEINNWDVESQKLREIYNSLEIKR